MATPQLQKNIVGLHAGEVIRDIFGKIKPDEVIVIMADQKEQNSQIKLIRSKSNEWYDYEILLIDPLTCHPPSQMISRVISRYHICIMPNDDFSQLYTPVFDDQPERFDQFKFCIGEINRHYDPAYKQHAKASSKYFDGLSTFKTDRRLCGFYYTVDPYGVRHVPIGKF